MIPMDFKEKNCMLTKEDCLPLPVYANGEQIVSCWKMSWKERIKALFYGKVWLSVMGEKTHPPVWLMCDKTVFEKEE